MSIKLGDFRRMLETKRNELSSELNRDDILIQNSADELERVQQLLNREVAISNLAWASRLLKSIEAALDRIEDGTYGVCLRCDEEIPEKRLNAVPWTSYCLVCQEELDGLLATGEKEKTSKRTPA
jgi:DnaK suppressor protein